VVIPVIDIAIILCLFLLIPKLVEKHLSNLGFRRELRLIIVLGGMLWITFACTHQLVYPILGIADGDAKTFEKFWYGSTVDIIESGNYGLLFRKLITPGRWFYVTSQSLFYYLTGGTVISILGFNSFMAFWGSLTLTRAIYRLCPDSSSTGTVLPLLLIFTPSVVFWSSANLKEALMYWAICQAFAIVAPMKSGKQMRGKFILFLFGGLIGCLLRPHLMIFWIVSVLLIKMFDPKFWKYGVVILLITPLFIGQVKKKINMESFYQNFVSAEQKMNSLISRNKGSTFDYDSSGPIIGLSGVKNTLFRPMLWRVKNLRSLMAAVEIWTISIGIIFLWMRMTNAEWKCIVRNPSIWVALLVLVPFFVFFTYFPNEGLLARQRVQVFPALLVLLATPILLRQRAGRFEPLRRPSTISRSYGAGEGLENGFIFNVSHRGTEITERDGRC